MDYDEDDNGKDDKIYDLFKLAMQESNLLEKLKWARILSFQLEKKHTDQLPKEFSIRDERKWIQDVLKNNKIKRTLELRYKVTDGIEGYKYFDKIENDNPNDVFNYDESVEDEISNIELRLIDFFASIVKTLNIETEGDEL